jgi:hypothetical protein
VPFLILRRYCVQISKHELRAFHIGKLWNEDVRQGVRQLLVPTERGLLGA